MTTGLIQAALATNASTSGITAAQAAQNIETAIIATIESAIITLTASSLQAPSGGGPVIQSGATIGTLS
jgi:hypothetical protein